MSEKEEGMYPPRMYIPCNQLHKPSAEAVTFPGKLEGYEPFISVRESLDSIRQVTKGAIEGTKDLAQKIREQDTIIRALELELQGVREAGGSKADIATRMTIGKLVDDKEEMKKYLEELLDASEQLVFGAHGAAYLPGQLQRFNKVVAKLKGEGYGKNRGL